MSQIEIYKRFIDLQEISEERNYWLVRTQGGIYFEDFYFENYIAIGWDRINDLDLISIDKRDELKERIELEYPNENRPGVIANQLIRFVNEMKKGDIVVIPSENSSRICFGELLEDDIYIEKMKTPDEFDIFCENDCPYEKRRKVNWLKIIKRDNLDPYLYRLLNSHYALTKANDYAHYIDRSLYSFFVKGDTGHVIFEVTKTKEIAAIDLMQLIHSIISVLDDFNSITGSKLDKRDIDIKINVQSSGPVEFFGNISSIAALAFFVLLIVGGGARFRQNINGSIEGEIKTDGLIEKLLKVIDHLHKNKMERIELENRLKEPIDKLKVKVPGVIEENIEDNHKEKAK